MIVLPIPLNNPPELDWVCAGIGGLCCCCGGGCIGLELVLELLGGGDLDPPLEPPLAIFVIDLNYYIYLSAQFLFYSLSFIIHHLCCLDSDKKL